jgi:hypothetical protein
MKKLSKEEYLERVEKKESVSRFEFELTFHFLEIRTEFLKIIADLSYANLSSADLSYADLSYADLSYANLSSANLSSANLSYADLSSADLSYANLSSAKGEFHFNFGIKMKVV